MSSPQKTLETVTYPELLPWGDGCHLAWIEGYQRQSYRFLGARLQIHKAKRLKTGPESIIIKSGLNEDD